MRCSEFTAIGEGSRKQGRTLREKLVVLIALTSPASLLLRVYSRMASTGVAHPATLLATVVMDITALQTE